VADTLSPLLDLGLWVLQLGPVIAVLILVGTVVTLADDDFR
jgi:hypothetical protein